MMDAILRQAAEAAEANDIVGMMDSSDALLTRDPAHPEGLFIAGMAMLRERRRGLATVLLNAASQVKPQEAGIWNNLACAMQDWHPEDALHILSKALAVNPDLHEAAANVASVLSQLGRWEESLEQSERVMAAAPDGSQARTDAEYNSALVLMQLGRWKEAWPRWRAGLGNRFRVQQHQDLPRWNGEPDAHVVVYGEQGLGDEILGASMYARARKAAQTWFFDCDERLEKLFRRSFPWAVVHGTRNDPHKPWRENSWATHQLECIGLGEFFAPEPYRTPAFLTPDPALRKAFRAWLDEQGHGPKIGIAWTGGAVDWDRQQRNIPPNLLSPIVMTPHARFVCLEYNNPRSSLPKTVRDLRWATNKGIDYDLTAALVAELDLVISVPTTVVELAGAVGTPCWVMAPEVPPWRLSETAGDEAWIYEGLRVFRRQGPLWGPVTSEVARALRAWIADRQAAKEAAQ